MPRSAILRALFFEAQAVQLHGELGIQLLHGDLAPRLPVRLGVTLHDVLVVTHAARMSRRDRQPTCRIAAGSARAAALDGLQQEDDREQRVDAR